jgi:hypothetical protein
MGYGLGQVTKPKGQIPSHSIGRHRQHGSENRGGQQL